MGINLSKEGRLARKYNADGKIFGEFKEGYFFTTCWFWDDKNSMYKLGKKRTEWVNMCQPLPCSYQKRNPETRKHEPVLLAETSTQSYNVTPPPVEYRGITLTQLRAIEANIVRRCEKERWTNHEGLFLIPETVTLYDALKYIIRPFTKDMGKSFVTCLPSTAGAQPPKFFASHWWGEPVIDFIKCIEQLVRDFARNCDDEDDRRGAGMTADTPIWVCAYANNQWHLGDDITINPKQSGFTRAMRVAEGRTVTILDKNGVVFTRIWCAFELFLTLVNKYEGGGTEMAIERLWAIYTVHPHTNTIYDQKRESIGIITGGAPADFGFPNNTARREADFPFHLIKQALAIKVETAEATEHSDKVHILNSIRGVAVDMIDDPPPPHDKKYYDVNDAVIAAFVSTIPSLQSASKESDEIWNEFLLAFSKGKKELKMEFRFNEGGWNGLTADRAIQLISHLPSTTVELRISDANFGIGFINEVTKFVSESAELVWLSLYDTYAGGEEEGQEAGVRLANAIASSCSLRDVGLCRTRLLFLKNLEQWGSALIKNKKLKVLWLDGVEDDIVEKLKKATIERSPELCIST